MAFQKKFGLFLMIVVTYSRCVDLEMATIEKWIFNAIFLIGAIIFLLPENKKNEPL